mmetsp:Transcript_4126/g.11861  ORF Transcript_4126/g.11861 Transcript_4126/m.11861 type:complete len:102 (+) Transcript_4126:958-1263(+)
MLLRLTASVGAAAAPVAGGRDGGCGDAAEPAAAAAGAVAAAAAAADAAFVELPLWPCAEPRGSASGDSPACGCADVPVCALAGPLRPRAGPLPYGRPAALP